MDPEEENEKESVSMKREMFLKLQERIEKATSETQASGSSASTSAELQNIYQELQELYKMTEKKAQVTSQIQHDLDKAFTVEEVGYTCDLCQRDLATDAERPGGSSRSLQEVCVLACGHVYHSKCLRGTTPDLDNGSTNPSCIFCISSSN